MNEKIVRKSKEEILKELESKADIEKEITIQYDGKQFMIKIPKEISEFLKIKKGDKLILKIEIPEDKKQPTINTFEIKK